MTQAQEIPNIKVEDIDHLGIIAGIIDDIGMVNIINESLGEHPQEQISAGHVVKALILNCMGFLSAPLYLFHQFFMGKATEHLLGEGIKGEYLNARRIGRVLDKLYRYGIATVFMQIAVELVKKFGVSLASVHGDSSSFYVHGEYEFCESEAEAESASGPKGVSGEKAQAKAEVKTESESEGEPKEDTAAKTTTGVGEEPDFTPIEIHRGYSRDHRPDLKQFTLNLITSSDGDIPLGIRVGNGNEVDTKVLVPFMKQWKDSWENLEGQSPQVLAADAALFTQENLGILGELPWISRVPASVGEAQKLMQTKTSEEFQPFSSPGLEEYCWSETSATYGGIEQRWIIVESQSRRDADLKTFAAKFSQQTQKGQKALEKLALQEFACQADAQKAANAFEKTLKFHRLEAITIEAQPHYKKQGRPSKDALPSHYSFHVKAQLVPNQDILQAHHTQAGRFIVATNILDTKTWDNQKVLLEYKNQTCERGFRFLKDPLFFVSRIFLKSTKRIMVLMMIMTLALMVYSLGQRQVRQTLEASQATVADQKGKPTARPTLRWLLQCFLCVHLVWVDGVKAVIQLTQQQQKILQFLSPNCRKYYLLC